MVMRSLIQPAFIASLVAVTANAQYSRTFMDDTGRRFSFQGQPKIAVRAGVGALSLYHLGVQSEQVAAVWGLWGTRGSDLDINNPEAGSLYTDSDPTPEEIDFLEQSVNLSPNCYTNPRGCHQWDDITDVIAMKDQIDYILFIDNGNDANMVTVEEETGIPVVFVDTFYEYSLTCRTSNFTSSEDEGACVARSMIDIAWRIEELAVAIGVDVDMGLVNKQKQAACQASAEFTRAMQTAHNNGIRIKGSIFDLTKDSEGKDIAIVRDFDPIELWVLRTLEELGAPLLHAGESKYVPADEYFTGCSTGVISADCNEETLFPVDFWIIDSRSYRIATTPEFLSLFPDQAMIEGQHWYYARNDGPITYVAISRMLLEMTDRISRAKRIHEKSLCTIADPKDVDIIKKDGGLTSNEYICYNSELIQEEYLKCPIDLSAAIATGTQSLSFAMGLFGCLLLVGLSW